MKIFWKLFITMLSIILLAFTVFGTMIVHSSFCIALDMETERSLGEMKMFQYALLASLESLPADYYAKETAVGDIVKSIEDNLNDDRIVLVVYNQKKEILYQNKIYKDRELDIDKNGNNGVWRISDYDNKKYIESFWRVNSSAGTYYLEMNKNINYIYEQRNRMYATYRWAVIIVFCIFSILLIVISFRFTRPIIRLSKATRELTGGNYNKTVEVKGNDEVATLSEDFNNMAKQLKENIHELSENVRRQEEFTEGFAHELKTPLTSIIGYADMIRSMDLSHEDTVLSAEYIFGQGKRLERLAYKMMELTYVGKQDIKPVKINVQDVMEKAVNVMSVALESKSIDIVVDVAKGYIYGDMDLLQSLFTNIIDNARKAVEERGCIKIYGVSLNDYYEVVVEDNGRGMEAFEVDKITEAFYMVDKSRARKEGGAGIGMTLCKKIADVHGAGLIIESEPDKGTRVKVHFISEVSGSGDENRKNE